MKHSGLLSPLLPLQLESGVVQCVGAGLMGHKEKRTRNGEQQEQKRKERVDAGKERDRWGVLLLRN